MKTVTISPFDAADYLDNDVVIAEYLNACLEDGDPAVFLAALGDVAKARGMAQLARDTGLSRESLYKTFASGTKPRFETIIKISTALGVPLAVRPHQETAHP